MSAAVFSRYHPGMESTSVSLLQRLRRPGEPEAWGRFVKLYTPLIYYWARRAGLQSQDASDLVQDVFTILVQKLPEFTYDEHKSFRGWLRTVTLNKWHDRRKRHSLPLTDAGASALSELPDANGADAFEEREYRQHIVSRALQLMQADFQPATWKACWEHVVSGRSAADVAAELGISVGAVYAAKFRVLSRLREELDGLLD